MSIRRLLGMLAAAAGAVTARWRRAALSLVSLLVVAVIAAFAWGGPVSDSDITTLRADGWTAVSTDVAGFADFESADQRIRAQVRLLAGNLAEAKLHSSGWYAKQRFFSDQVGDPQTLQLPWKGQLRASRVVFSWVDCPGVDCGAYVAKLWYGYSVVEVQVRAIGPSQPRDVLGDAFRGLVSTIDPQLAAA